ncbi:DUF302 domain-containing protein [Kiloniella laminariae]|uniref:DUF302 domain-containing protein n=1 Tax=Kiloniella laminariae TaxID=454162 RepID=A0ABT4LEG9_9PROT|nr:DUF302 domain-containing protein [Kiloniella laminariae]MCZ4279499.1 DUF302 domain-containing protein [Kiloniella laminariae]
MIRRRYAFLHTLGGLLSLVTGLLMGLGLLVAPSSFSSALADQGFPQDGMVVVKTDKAFTVLVADLERAIKENKMGLVTRASASAGAAGQGITIPGNMVVGVYRNDFARRMLEASLPAGIEAPIRFYLTENDDGSASLTYQKPTAVFAPYGSADLDVMAAELDVIFDAIAKEATQ